MQSFFQRRRILLIHLLFWCVYFTFFLYQISMPRRGGAEREFEDLFGDAVFHVAMTMVVAYINYFYFFPRFLKHKNTGRYVLEFIIPFAVCITIMVYGKQYIVDGFSGQMKFFYTERFFIYLSLNTLFIVLFVAILKFVEDWLELEARRKELENEKLTAELRFLKAQINPHFLFNTLNNLYYLAFTNSPNTTEVIAKLSQMMRYMIYDSNTAKISLEKEIEYMHNYISLEKLRLNTEVPILFETSENTEGAFRDGREGVQIVPLVLITFLENAFKHGVSNSAENAWVKIKIEVEGKTLHYTVENSQLKQKDEKTKEKSGIGLQNVQRRLDLSYPNQYTLDVQNLEDRYIVDLTIPL
jgi:two-component system, LytTR family, sensor histidine kinase AlgZ